MEFRLMLQEIPKQQVLLLLVLMEFKPGSDDVFVNKLDTNGNKNRYVSVESNQ